MIIQLCLLATHSHLYPLGPSSSPASPAPHQRTLSPSRKGKEKAVVEDDDDDGPKPKRIRLKKEAIPEEEVKKVLNSPKQAKEEDIEMEDVISSAAEDEPEEHPDEDEGEDEVDEDDEGGDSQSAEAALSKTTEVDVKGGWKESEP